MATCTIPALLETDALRAAVNRRLANAAAHDLAPEAARWLAAAQIELARRGSLRVREYGDRRWEFTLFAPSGEPVAHLDDYRAESLAKNAGVAAAKRLAVKL